MSEKGTDSESDGWERRDILRTTVAAGMGVPFLTSTSRASAASEKVDPPTPYPATGVVSVSSGTATYFTHVAEFNSTKRMLNRYESTGTPGELFHHALVEKLHTNPSKSTFNLVVNTMGERTSETRTGRKSRTLYGFRPKESEIETLSQFGDVTHVGDVVSTKVCLRNVTRDDVVRLAHLPFVVEINRMPDPIEPNKNVDASEVVGSSWGQFTNAHGNYSEYIATLGIMGSGYDADTYGEYASNYANDVGFNDSLSKDFTDESDPYNDTAWGGHATNVGDTAAYMLKDGHTHSDLFASLKVVSGSTDLTDENIRQALQHATKKGIDVLNMSFGINSWQQCPSDYCEELDSYTTDGGVPVAAVGNKDNDSKVEYPACSWHTVGVGGVNKKDDNGNAVAVPDTEYGNVLFYDPFSKTMHCKWCYNASGDYSSFSPESYGVSKVLPDANNPRELDGTSFACPQVAAAAWINFADGGVDSYSSAMSKFKNMGEYNVVNNDESTDAAKEGDLMEADYY